MTHPDTIKLRKLEDDFLRKVEYICQTSLNILGGRKPMYGEADQWPYILHDIEKRSKEMREAANTVAKIKDVLGE